MNEGLNKFKLTDRIAVITGGAGLLGVKHAEAIAEVGGVPVLWDIDSDCIHNISKNITEKYNVPCLGMKIDITDSKSIESGMNKVLNRFNGIHILINNAARNPKVTNTNNSVWSRVENFPLDLWRKDLEISLTGAFLCSRTIGSYMAHHDGGVILNIASDLGVIAPDQRIYRNNGVEENKQPVKPVTYSVVKHGIIGLTKYFATYWAKENVRVNAISPGGVYVDQPEEFVAKLSNLIPMGRMAHQDEYKSSVIYLVSDASSYMTGANLIVDGGRTCW